MAKSSGITGFDYRGSLLGVDSSPVLKKFRVDDSATLSLGEPVCLDQDGFVDGAAVGGSILGIVMGLTDQDGINIFESGRAGGTDGSTLSGDDTITVSSTNTSDATRYVQALVCITNGLNSCWYNNADDDLSIANLGQFFDINSGGQTIDVATASDANGQFQLVEIDPDGDGDASKGIFIVNEPQIGPGPLDTATAKISA